MIRFSNGHAFEYMAASGTLKFNGKGWPWEKPFYWIGLLDPSRFTVVIKTLTYHPYRGNLRRYNPTRCIRPIPDGFVNAIGLTNPGIYWWCREIGPRVNSAKIPIVGSIFGDPGVLAEMANMLNDFNLVGLEINASCPNTETDILQNTSRVIESCEAVLQASRFPIILKVSVVHDIEQVIKGVKGMVEAISINTVPWAIVFPNRRSPLETLGGGGVSGKAAQPFTWALAEKISEITTIPVIWPSIWDFEDLGKVRDKRARAVSFGSVFLRYPWRPTLFVRREQKLKKQGGLRK